MRLVSLSLSVCLSGALALMSMSMIREAPDVKIFGGHGALVVIRILFEACLGFRVWGWGFRVQGSGFRVYGLGFRVGLRV